MEGWSNGWNVGWAMQIVKAADAKEIVFDNLSRKKMQDGINKLADAVGVTLGPRGELVTLLISFVQSKP